jgi:hypothetical protein
MSVASYPRLHVSGRFVTNVCTANNNMITENYVDDAAVSVDGAGRSDADLRQWLQQIPPDGGGIRGGWNVFGDNGCGFDTVVVHSIELGPGQILRTAADDPLIGATLTIGRAGRRSAVMVDCDPEGSLGTQIFSDEVALALGTANVCKAAPTLAFSRWLSFRRNLGAGGFTGGSAVWQMGLPIDSLTYGAQTSAALDALRTAGTRGLLVRFCTYLLAPGIADTDLAARFAAGGTDTNHATGILIGTLGPWQDDDPLATLPTGRRLSPSATLSLAHVPYQLGPAVARVHPDQATVTLDLINTVPEQDTSLAKVALGAASLVLEVPGEATPRTVGPVAYDRATYEATAGLVDVPVPADLRPMLAHGGLALRLDTSGTLALRETTDVVETDDRARYVQQGGSATITLVARTLGAPPATPMDIAVEQYVTSNGAPATLAADPERVVEVDSPVQTDGDGTAVVTVTGLAPGTCVLRFVTPGRPAGTFGGPLDFFTNVRVLPTDDFSAVPDSDLTFAFIYENVLRYYWVIYPTMDRFVDLHTETDVVAKADALRARIAEDRWRHVDYMPRTRELSDGKRALLDRWLALQGG